MANIKLTDQLQVDLDVELGEDSAIAKYLKDLKRLKLPDLKLSDLQGKTLDKVSIKSLQSGLAFEQEVGVGADGPELKISAGVSGSVRLFSSKDKQLFDPDVFGDPVPVGKDQFYVGVNAKATISADLSGKASDLGFGFTAGTGVLLTTYTRFEKNAVGAFTDAADALRDVFRGFTIPGDLEDLAAMPTGTVATVEGTGSLKFSGSFDLLSVVNPLAVVGLPEPLGEINVASAGAIKVGASVEISGAYQLRVQKTAKATVRLGYYRKRAEDFTLKVSASLGLTAGVGKLDLIEQLLKAVSKNPEADKAALAHGGLKDDQIDGIKKVVEAGVSRKLELALGSELGAGASSEAAFLFEVDLGALDEAGKLAVHDALDGNLAGLGKEEGKLPLGITLVRSVFTEVRKRKHSVKFNLLGIYNFISVSSLMLKGIVMYEPATGELIITDKATASRIAASTLSFAADSEKLRKVMAESVLVTATYRCSKLVAEPPELKIAHTYFELHTKTDRTAMRNNLDVLEALGLMTTGEKKKILDSANKFGHSMLHAETGYDDTLVSELFLKNGAARKQEDYERAGRNALKLLVQPGEDDARRLPATDDALWREMQQQGQFNFKFIEKLRGLNPAQLGAVTTDYTVIVWWAESMRELSQRLVEIRKFVEDNPNIDPENNAFKALRKRLASKLKEVAANTKAEFGDPWGLVAMDQVSGRKASASARITATNLTVFKERGA